MVMFVFIRRLALFPILAACLNVYAQASTYLIDNPTMICKAHFKSSFAGFITQDGDDFLLEFDEGEHETKRRWGYRYNGVIVGEHASMLLNWPGDEQSGILTVLAADYPCRASYSAEKLQQVAAIEESTPPEVDEPEADESGSTNRTNSVLMAEVGAIVEQEGAPQEPAVGSRQTTGVPSASGQTSSALSPNAVENAASSQTANSNLTSAPSISITGITADGPQGLLRDMSRTDWRCGTANRWTHRAGGQCRRLLGQNLRANRRYRGHLDGLQHGRTVDSHVGHAGAC